MPSVTQKYTDCEIELILSVVFGRIELKKITDPERNNTMEVEMIPTLEADEYAGEQWLYEPHVYMPYRYVPGRPST